MNAHQRRTYRRMLARYLIEQGVPVTQWDSLATLRAAATALWFDLMTRL